MKNNKKTPNIKKNTIKFNITPEQIEKVRPYVKNFDKVILQDFYSFASALDDAVEANMEKDYTHTETSKMLQDILFDVTGEYHRNLSHEEKEKIVFIDDHIPTTEEIDESLKHLTKEELDAIDRKFGFTPNN